MLPLQSEPMLHVAALVLLPACNELWSRQNAGEAHRIQVFGGFDETVGKESVAEALSAKCGDPLWHL